MELKLYNLQSCMYFISNINSNNNIKYGGIYISKNITCYHNDIGKVMGYSRVYQNKNFKL